MTSHLQRVALAAAVLLSAPIHAPGAPARAAGLILDGLRDDGYRLLAQDSSGDLASVFSIDPSKNWADLTNLYVATDTTSLWVYADLPNYSSQSIGDFGLAIDTDSLAGSGSSTGPNLDGITFAYTSTRNNVGASPVVTTNILLPDVLIHGHLFSPVGTFPIGGTWLNHWTGTQWDDTDLNWGGVTSDTIGTHVGFSYGHGIELSIPFADLGVAPTTTLHLEFYATGPNGFGPDLSGAWDTIPSDAQSQKQYEATTQRRLATFNPLDHLPVISLSAAIYSVAEVDARAPITITLAPTSTQLISVTFQTANGTAGPADYIALTQVITLAPGQSSRVVPLVVLADSLVEPDETVLLSLSQPANAQLGQPITATLTIHDSTLAQGQLFLPLVRR